MGYDRGGRVVIVTGASSGIGRAIALDLSARGATVVAAARRADLLASLVSEATGNVESVPTDIGDRASAEALISSTRERHGKIDVLVNNAGIPMRIHATRLTVEDVERVMQINFMGAVFTTLAALPSMIAVKHGHIVNVSSVAGRVGNPREGAYSASKFAMTGWSEVLSADLDRTGVRVHAVYPGPIKTEIWDKITEPARYAGKFYPPELVARAVRRVVERDRFEAWAPRKFGYVRFARALFPEPFVRGLARYDRPR